MAFGASSSSSFTTSVFTYDAFLSFRGEDTRFSFTGNLYSALDRRGIFTFIDDQGIGKGNEITPSLVKAIEESRIAIVVLSKNYASSSFCLDELAKIMDCFKEKKSRLVIPVFYDVDPSHVRKQIGTFGKALAEHENNFKANSNTKNFNDNMERLKKWRVALKQVADLSGYHFKHGYGYEHTFIAKIVHQVSREIRRVALHFVDHPVGLDHQVEKVISVLDVGSSDGVCILGLYGIGGIGKTTLAMAVYNWIADHFEDLSFEGLCFLENIREKSNQHGLEHLQKIILSKILEEKEIELTSVKEGISMLTQRLRRKKILLILDDVDQHEQLEALAGKSNWFGSGTKVVITTRAINLLSRYEDKITYELGTLNEEDALKLLSLKALKTNQVDSSYRDILSEVAIYASGLPLALEVIGSNLVGKSIEQWKSALCQYNSIPNKKIQTILKVSFDALEEFEKKIFLDISCCLKGYALKDVKEILCAHHGVAFVEYGLGVLVEKSLMKIDAHWECLTLHDLIQDMGREIVRQESLKNPGERSRLWLLEDIVQVFERNEGTNKIEMIHMDFPTSKKVVDWDGEAFKKMTKIGTLIIERAFFSQGPKLLPNSLRVLKWQQYPSHSLPDGFHSEELVILQLGGFCSMSVEFICKQKFKSLTVIRFDQSNIEEIPDVSGVPNLKELTFSSCHNLIKVHESVGSLGKLKLLDATYCESLSSFPSIRLTNLESLGLEWCYSLKNFPEILVEMENIVEIQVMGTSIKELPSSIAYLSKLRRLTVNSATSLCRIAMLPCLEELSFWRSGEGLQFPKLDEGEEQRSSMLSPKCIKVSLLGCNMSDEYWPVLVAWFRNVVVLELSLNNFTVLPESIQELCSLRRLHLTGCKKLKEIVGIPPNMNDFMAAQCISLTSSSKMMLLNEEFHKDGNKFVQLPGNSIPEWFEHNTTGSTTPEWFKYNDTESKIEFWCRNKVPELCLCVIGDNYIPRERILWDLFINGNVVEFSTSLPSHIRCIGPEHIGIFGLKRVTCDHDNMDEFLSENEWNHVECYFYPINQAMRWETGVPMRWKIGVHFINHKSRMEDDVQFSDPEDHPPAKNSLKDCVSNSVAQIGISSTTNNVQGSYDDLRRDGMELSSRPCWQAPVDCDKWNSSLVQLALANDTIRDEDQVLDHLENCQVESSQAPSYAEMQNIQVLRPTSSSAKPHLKTCCTVFPTKTEESSRNQVEQSQEHVEMESSLDAGTHILSHSHDHSSTTAASEDSKDALKLVQDFTTNVPFTNPSPLKSSKDNDVGNQLTLLDNGLRVVQQLSLLKSNIPTCCEPVEYTEEDRISLHPFLDVAYCSSYSDSDSEPQSLVASPVEEEPLEDAYSNSDSNSMQSPRAIHATNSLPKKCLVLFICLLLIVVSLFGSTMWHWCFHRKYTLTGTKYDEAVLHDPEKALEESSQAAGFSKTQNTEAQRSTLSSGKISGQELHLSSTLLPTTIDESVRVQLEPSDDDAEMEAFYASLDADNYVLLHSYDHSAPSVTSEKVKEALKILQDFIIKDPSFLLDPKQCSTFKTSLDYLSSLSANDDGLSGEIRALISEASKMFTHSSRDYIEASMKIESTSSELLKVDELESDMEDNKNQFKEIVALEKELLQKLVYLEESKKELEKQINAIEASISASQSEQSLTREKKREIFEEGKILKTQITEFRGKVPHLQHVRDLAREIQAKITAEWSELGEKFKKIVVE